MLKNKNLLNFLWISLLLLLLSSLSLAAVIKTDDVKKWAEENSHQPFTFVVIGDTRPAAANESLPVDILSEIFKEISLIRPDFIIHVGDIVFGYNEKYEHVKEILTEFTKIYKKYCGDIPLIIVPGNHDVQAGKGALKAFQEIFGKKMYYHFYYGNSHFIVLNTNFPMPGALMKVGLFNLNDGQHKKPMLDWLNDLLETSTSSFTILLSHAPLLTSEIILKLLNSKADLYIAAHWHITSERKLEQAKVLIVGGGGAPLNAPLESSIEKGLGVFSYAVVSISDEINTKFLTPFSIHSRTSYIDSFIEITLTNRTHSKILLKGIKIHIPWEKYEIKAWLKLILIDLPLKPRVLEVVDNSIGLAVSLPPVSVIHIKVIKK